jgi:hypothetical protein
MCLDDEDKEKRGKESKGNVNQTDVQVHSIVPVDL